MKKALIFCTVLAVFMGIAVIALYFGPATAPKDTEPPETVKKDPPKDIEVSFSADLSDYEAYMDPENADAFLTLVNKQSKLEKTDAPAELAAVKDAKKEIFLQETAARALEAMFIEMRAAGFTDVFVTSAYRTYDYQSSLFNTYITTEMANGLSYDAARKKVLTYSAEPGTSEHQTGLAVDLMTGSMTELDESFADHPVYVWLTKNAWKFGFVLRFPADKTDITGYSYEPWHYRFVGRAHAYEMYQKSLCLEEYLERR